MGPFGIGKHWACLRRNLTSLQSANLCKLYAVSIRNNSDRYLASGDNDTFSATLKCFLLIN